jgi:DNA-binding LacI/PurR family transcriptional regulator
MRADGSRSGVSTTIDAAPQSLVLYSTISRTINGKNNIFPETCSQVICAASEPGRQNQYRVPTAFSTNHKLISLHTEDVPFNYSQLGGIEEAC